MVLRQSPSKLVHIFSDGDPATTRVVAPDGTEIPHVMAFTVTGEAREYIKISIEIMMPVLDVDGLLESTTLRCPVCGFDHTHRCGSSI